MAPRPRKYTFYLDENFPIPAGKFLRTLGHTVYEGLKVLGKAGKPDYQHLKASTKMGAILLSFDRDFVINLDLKEKIQRSPGVILVEATDTRPQTAKRVLYKVLKVITRRSIEGKICRASIDRIKIE